MFHPRTTGGPLALLDTALSIGALLALVYLLYSLSLFLHLHFVHRADLRIYQDVSASNYRTWALVTGASDGIGKGFVCRPPSPVRGAAGCSC